MNFKELISSKGFTMYKLAKQSKLGKSTISEIANKNRENPNMSTLISISKTLNISIDTLCKSLEETE